MGTRATAETAGKRVLVTGGAGFLGSHLCDALVRDGAARVVCLDNFLSGRMSNVEHLLASPCFSVVRHDVGDEMCSEVQAQVGDVDLIFHLACPASPFFYQHSALHTIRTCVMGTTHMLELARRQQAVILLASTSEVYGNPSMHPQQEAYHGDVNPIGVRACYDEGKRVAETLAFDYMRTYGVQVRVARIFNSYGPRMHRADGRVTSNFIVQAIRGKDITIYGDGSQTRSFCFCLDTIAGLRALMHNEAQHPGPVNIGMPKETTIQQFAETVVRLVGTESKVANLPLPSDDPCRRLPCIERARKLMAWEPQVGLEEGLAATVEYFRREVQEEEEDPLLAKERVDSTRRREAWETEYRQSLADLGA